MKKNGLFTVLLLIIGILLFLLKATGLPAHIAISVIGLALLVIYTIITKKSWKKPALEILMRVFYAVALITGVIIMNVHGIAVLAILHKLCAAGFVILLIVLSLQKLSKK